MTWDMARDFCEQHGAYLVEVESDEEQTAIKNGQILGRINSSAQISMSLWVLFIFSNL